MGFKSSEWAYNVPNLTAPERAVLVALAHCHNDKTGACFPGQDTLVEMTALSEKTVRRALASLDSRELPVIARTPRFAGRYRTSDSYELLFDNYRSDRPPVTLTTGQPDHRSESPRPPVTVSLTTGHSDHPIEEEQEVEQEEEQEDSSAPAARDLEQDFNRAWANWPKRVERKKSLAAFIKATKTRDVDQLVADIIRFGDAYAATTQRQFVPALCVWLNGERWTDELPTGHPTDARLTPTQRAMQTATAGRNVASKFGQNLDTYARTFGQQRQENALALVARYQQQEQAAEFPPGHIPTDTEWNALLADPKPQGTPGPPRMSELTSSYCAEHLGYPIVNGVCDKCEQIRLEGAA